MSCPEVAPCVVAIASSSGVDWPTYVVSLLGAVGLSGGLTAWVSYRLRKRELAVTWQRDRVMEHVVELLSLVQQFEDVAHKASGIYGVLQGKSSADDEYQGFQKQMRLLNVDIVRRNHLVALVGAEDVTAAAKALGHFVTHDLWAAIPEPKVGLFREKYGRVAELRTELLQAARKSLGV
jgi:hypothetical protein